MDPKKLQAFVTEEFQKEILPGLMSTFLSHTW